MHPAVGTISTLMNTSKQQTVKEEIYKNTLLRQIKKKIPNGKTLTKNYQK